MWFKSAAATASMVSTAALALFASLPSQAAVYTGVWDPAYGAPFTNLGWRGSAHYSLSDSCAPEGSGDVTISSSCAAEVTDAKVEFYDLRTAGQPALATLVFDPLSLTISTLRFLDGELSQLVTTASSSVRPESDLTAFGVSGFTGFSLSFAMDGPHLYWIDCGVELLVCGRGANDSVNAPPRFTITRDGSAVPEPGTLALSGLALLAAWSRRRTRSRA